MRFNDRTSLFWLELSISLTRLTKQMRAVKLLLFRERHNRSSVTASTSSLIPLSLVLVRTSQRLIAVDAGNARPCNKVFSFTVSAWGYCFEIPYYSSVTVKDWRVVHEKLIVSGVFVDNTPKCEHTPVARRGASAFLSVTTNSNFVSTSSMMSFIK